MIDFFLDVIGAALSIALGLVIAYCFLWALQFVPRLYQWTSRLVDQCSERSPHDRR